MRLIDADAVYNKALENHQKGEIEDWEFDTIINYLDGAPTINTAEIVYCKGCRWRGREECAMFYRCECGEQHTWETDNDFCSYGGQKEDSPCES